MSNPMMDSEPLKFKARSILDEYEVQWSSKLGCGISGPVRPCTNKQTGQKFALKCLVDRPRARLEVNLHKKCSGHPNIVSIFDVYCNEVQFPGESAPRSRLLVVMELMEGGELFDRISAQKHFTEYQAAVYTKQIASAIDRCHSLNIAHRDLKPENLLLNNKSEDALIKLSDFGFAKADQGDLMTPHFTPYYVAPQVLEAQQQQRQEKGGTNCIGPAVSPYTYDKSCDMWSLGVIIYIMLCGYPPFYSETPTKQITKTMKKKIMAGQYELPDADWKHISVPAKDVVKRLLLVDPGQRLTVRQVLDHAWLREAPQTALQSPAVFQNSTMLFDMQEAHSQQLTAMRLPENRVSLKPMSAANNALLKKRGVGGLRTPAVLPEPREGPPPAKQSSAELAVQKLRDVIAHCILPREGGQDRLTELVRDAISHNRDSQALGHALQHSGWNGSTFPEQFDRNKLALRLSEIVRTRTKKS